MTGCVSLAFVKLYGNRSLGVMTLIRYKVDSPISSVTLHRIALPTRREHKWTGLTEPIGGFVLIRMEDNDGRAGWGEAPVLKDWGGDHGRYFGETPQTTVHIIKDILGPALKGEDPRCFEHIHA